MPAGSVAVLSTGDGVEHSELATDDGPCRFVQVWLRTGDGLVDAGVHRRTRTPTTDRSRSPARCSTWRGSSPASPSRCPPRRSCTRTSSPAPCLRSSLAEPLSAGDAFEMTDEGAHEVTAGVPTELLVWTFG